MSRALQSLGTQYSDSENEGEEDKKDVRRSVANDNDSVSAKHKMHLAVIDARPQSASNSPVSVLGSTAIEALNKSNERQHIDDRIENFDDNICDEEYEECFSSPIEFHRSLVGVSHSNIKIPSEPSGRCSNSLLEKINKLYGKMKDGMDMNNLIQSRKDFRNPSIYEKLIAYCDIDELGTNFPPEIYDPHKWGQQSYYEELAKKQKEEMDKKDRERRDRTKVEFVTGTARKSTADGVESRKRSKWDVGGKPTREDIRTEWLIKRLQ